MYISHTSRVFFLILVFLGVTLTILLLTHESKETVVEIQDKVVVDIPAVAANNYADHIRPWLESAVTDSSADNIAKIRQNMLSLRSDSADIGTAHIQVFLGFDAWSEGSLEIAREKFLLAQEILPELAIEFDKLLAIL